MILFWIESNLSLETIFDEPSVLEFRDLKNNSSRLIVL